MQCCRLWFGRGGVVDMDVGSVAEWSNNETAHALRSCWNEPKKRFAHSYAQGTNRVPISVTLR